MKQHPLLDDCSLTPFIHFSHSCSCHFATAQPFYKGLLTCVRVPVDEAVDSVFQDSVDLLLHLLFLCHFDLCDLRRRVHTNPGAEDLTHAHTHQKCLLSNYKNLKSISK